VSTTSDFNLVLPSDEFAERALLGSMLIDKRYTNEVFSDLSSEDFYSASNKKIASAISYLVNKGKHIDIITISEYLKRKKELKFVGGYDYINSLTDGIPQNLNISEYIKIVKDRSSLRKIIITSMGVIQKGVENKTEGRYNKNF
jgi:replicative DNA helicase